MLLTRFCQDDRVRIPQPGRNLQIKFHDKSRKNDFVAYIDGIGKLDGRRCLLEWKTSASRYPNEPACTAGSRPATGLLFVDSGISEVAQIVFVRKRIVEIQYLRTTITERSGRISVV